MKNKTMLSVNQMPLMRPVPMTKSDKLRRWQLEQDYHLMFNGKKLFARKGFIFDGASIPRLFRRIYSPVGYLFLAGLFHDICYKRAGLTYVETQTGGESYKTVPMSKEESDQLFKDIANKFYPTHKKKTWVAYWALKLGGFVAWNGHRKNNSEKLPKSRKYVDEDSGDQYS